MRFFATYFDVNYLPRGVALVRSLRRHAGPFTLYVLCLDDAAVAALARLAMPEVIAIPLGELEQADPELRAVRDSRSRVEYYFTCTAAFLRHLLERNPAIDLLTYLDADLWFFSDPAPLYDELGDGSVAIIAHRFPPHLEHLARFGIYNVGLLMFRNDPRGRTVLDWWRARCIEWCYDRLEDGRFADQKYLDDWTERFEGVIVLEHPGANLAPWNMARHAITERDGVVMVDDRPLVFHHFHKLRSVGPMLYDAGVSDRRARLGGVVRKRIYAPYLRELRDVMRTVGGRTLGSARRAMPLKDRVRILLTHRLVLLLGGGSAIVDVLGTVRWRKE